MWPETHGEGQIASSRYDLSGCGIADQKPASKPLAIFVPPAAVRREIPTYLTIRTMGPVLPRSFRTLS
jgi:hypothetical protein